MQKLAWRSKKRIGRIFDSYSKFRIFERFPAIRFDSKFAAINEYRSNVFFHVLRRKIGSGRDFAFPDTNFVKALLAMLSALRLVAGSKHAPRAFGSATWQAGASSDHGIHKTNQNKTIATYIKT